MQVNRCTDPCKTPGGIGRTRASEQASTLNAPGTKEMHSADAFLCNRFFSFLSLLLSVSDFISELNHIPISYLSFLYIPFFLLFLFYFLSIYLFIYIILFLALYFILFFFFANVFAFSLTDVPLRHICISSSLFSISFFFVVVVVFLYEALTFSKKFLKRLYRFVDIGRGYVEGLCSNPETK